MITVDTHVIIWNALKPSLLSRNAKKAIEKANDSEGILFCEISLWEIAMMIKMKKLIIDISYLEFIKLLRAANNYIFKELTPEIVGLSVDLPAEINRDPVDRIICATSILNNTQLVTADKNLRKAKSLKTIW